MQKNLTDTKPEGNNELSDYDVLEIYIRCVATFVDRCSKYDLDNHTPFVLGKELWEESIKTLKEYRKEYSPRDSKR